MKLAHIVDDLLLIIHQGLIPNDSIYDRRLIINWINNQRALWLTNEYNKKREIRNNEVQSIYVDMEVVDAASLSTTINSDVTVLKSVNKVPRTLQLQTRDGITAIRSLMNIGERINYVSREQAIYSGNGILNSNQIFAFKYHDYIWLKYGQQNLKAFIPTKLLVEGVFENPLEIDDFNGTADNILTGVDEYPISRSFIEYIKEAVIKFNVASFINAPVDKSGDDEHTIK